MRSIYREKKHKNDLREGYNMSRNTGKRIKIWEKLLVPEGFKGHFRVHCTDMVNNTIGELVDGHFSR